MKKLALSLLGAAALAAAPSAASAQASGTINATAIVQTVLNFGAATDLNFGSVVPGQGATAAGSIELRRNVGVIFTLDNGTATGRLTRAGGTETMQPAYTCGVGTTATTIVTAFGSCTPADGTTGVLTLTAPTGTVTEYVIFRGTLTGTQTQITPGTYNGTIQITATAN